MAGGVFSEAQLFGMTIRESANDGSDFTNPAADYRRLFLGEDGILHLKDSSGTVTDIGGGGMTNPMTTAGDIIVGGVSGAPARLAAGAVGTVLAGGGAGVASSYVAGRLMGISYVKEGAGTTISNSATDVASATLTIVPTIIETWVVMADFDFNWSTANAGNLGIGDVDFSGTGTKNIPSIVLQGDQIGRKTTGIVGTVTGVSAASHTIKLTAAKTGAGGVLVTEGVSRLVVMRFSE
jgi:hypothetical protein